MTEKVEIAFGNLHYYDSYCYRATRFVDALSWADQLIVLLKTRESLVQDLRRTDGRTYRAKTLMSGINEANEKLRQHMAKVQP